MAVLYIQSPENKNFHTYLSDFPHGMSVIFNAQNRPFAQDWELRINISMTCWKSKALLFLPPSQTTEDQWSPLPSFLLLMELYHLP